MSVRLSSAYNHFRKIHPLMLSLPSTVRTHEPAANAAIARRRRRAHPPEVGPDRVHRPPGQRRQLHERAAQRRCRVDRRQEPGRAGPGAHPVQQRAVDLGE